MKLEIKALTFKRFSKTVKWLKDPFVRNGLEISKTPTVLSNAIWYNNKKNVEIFGIFVHNNHIGNITIINHLKHLKELQIFIGEKSYYGKSIASMIIDMYFKKIPYKTNIFVRVNPDNIPAFKTYIKSKFQKFDKNKLGFLQIQTSFIILSRRGKLHR